MARVLLDKGISAQDLENGVEFTVEEQDESSEDESFNDAGFDDLKRQINDIGIKSKDLLLPFDELKNLMSPVTGDGGVMKQIIKWGNGVIIPTKSVVIVHYDAFKENDKTPFDSTRLRNRPYKFLLGDGNVIPGLDLAIKTMKKEEISKFLISSEYAYGAMGCPPRIPGGAQILYVVEILNFYDSKEVIEFEEMAPEDQKKASFEKICAVFHCEHQMGNELFRSKHYKPAIARYRRMVTLLEDVSVANEEEDNKRKEYLLKLYSNLSVCYAHERNSSKAIIYADLALKIDENNPKAQYRMAYALYLADNYDRATLYANKAKKQKPFDKNINRLLVDIEKKRKEHRQWEKVFFKNMFSSEPAKKPDEISEPSSITELRTVLEKVFTKFIGSDEKELRFSEGYTDDQVEVVKSLARKHNLAFVKKIYNDSRIIKVAKRNTESASNVSGECNG